MPYNPHHHISVKWYGYYGNNQYLWCFIIYIKISNNLVTLSSLWKVIHKYYEMATESRCFLCPNPDCNWRNLRNNHVTGTWVTFQITKLHVAELHYHIEMAPLSQPSLQNHYYKTVPLIKGLRYDTKIYAYLRKNF